MQFSGKDCLGGWLFTIIPFFYSFQRFAAGYFFCRIPIHSFRHGKKMSAMALSSIILGRLLLAFYFLKAGINNILHFQRVAGLLKTKSIPLAPLALTVVIAIQLLGSIAVILNVYTLIASIALILFTLAANFLICNYWTMEGLQRKNVSFVFYANIAVIGALLLLSGMNAGN